MGCALGADPLRDNAFPLREEPKVSSRKRNRLAVGALALAILLGLSACGGSGETGSTQESTSSSSPETADTSETSSDTSEPAPETSDAETSDAETTAAEEPADDEAAVAAARALVPDETRASGTFVVGTETGYPPYAFLGDDPSTPIGIAPELMAAVADVLDLALDLQPTTYAAYIPGVQNGKYDIAGSGVYDTPERVKEVDMVDFISDGQAILVAKGNPEDLNKDNLCGHPVGAPAGTTTINVTLPDLSAACEAAGKPAIQISSFPSVSDARVALLSGRVVAVGGGTVVFQFMEQQTEGELVVADHFSPQLVGMVLQKDSPLTKAVQAALQVLMDNGTYEEILTKWGVYDTALPCISVNGDSASCIK